VGAAVAAFDRGATLFRVHDVPAHVEALAAASAVERGSVVA
jgi:dihydropteroate synthase